MGERVSDESGVIICGRKPESYDPTLKSEDGKCPHCGVTGELDMGYGLAAGGCGSYNFCMACERFCDFVSDPLL
jgi:hypothetical protein